MKLPCLKKISIGDSEMQRKLFEEATTLLSFMSVCKECTYTSMSFEAKYTHGWEPEGTQE